MKTNEELVKDGLVIRVDFYKVSSGKWKYGGEVNIGKARMWSREDYLQAIVDNQEIIHDGWQEHEEFMVVTDDTSYNWSRPDYHEFNKAIFMPHKFKGIKRRDKNEI